MVENFGPVRETEGVDRLVRGWKAVVSAWAIVLVVALLLAGVHEFRARPDSAVTPSPGQIGAMIPRHDPVCGATELSATPPPASCLNTYSPMNGPDAAIPEW